MKKIIVVKQHDITDCGPACLSSIIQFHGGFVPLEILRLKCETSIEGTSAFNLIETAKYYNLKAKAIKLSNLNELDIKSFAPCIAHLTLENGLKHYVVIYEIKKKEVLLMDPSVGKVKMDISNFNKVFNNIIILFQKKTTLISYEKPKNIKQIIASFLISNKIVTLKLITTSIILIIITLFSNYFLKLGSYFTSGVYGMDLYFILVMIFLFLYVCKNLLEYIKNNLIINLNKNISASLYHDFSHQLYVLPLSFIKSKTSGEIISRYNELNEYNNILPQLIISIFLDLMMALISLCFLASISGFLVFLASIFMLIYLLISFAFKNPTLQRINKNINYQSNFNTNIIDNVNNIISTKYMNNEKNMEKRLEKASVRYIFHNMIMEKFLAKLEFLKSILYDISNWIILSVGLYMCVIGKINIVDLFTFEIILNYFEEPIKDITNIIPKICFINASLYKLSEFMIVQNKVKGSYTFENGPIEIKNLSYSYENDRYILKDFSALILNQSKVLIQGMSGSGKSTLCQIISKQLDYNKGIIKINDVNIKDIDEKNFRENVSYIGQKDALIVDTIQNNIIYERNIDENKFKTICKICEIDEIVDKKTDRFETLVYESAANLSGGERQRISLARGLLKPANIIILDEALSEVNKDMEERILKKIFDYFKDRTILYVSHKNYNKIFDQVIRIGT